MKPDIQTLYARILRDFRSRMDDAETLYLKLCRAILSAMEQDDAAGAVFPDRDIAELLGQYRAMLRSITADVSRIYRAPVRVFPVTEDTPWLNIMDAGNAQLEELERIVDQLYRENKMQPEHPANRVRTAQRNIWSSIMSEVNFRQVYEDMFRKAASFKAPETAEEKECAAAVISEAVEKAKGVRGDSLLNDPETAGMWNDVKAQLTVILVELVAKLCGLYGLRSRKNRECAISFVEAVLADTETLALLDGADRPLNADACSVLACALGRFCRDEFEAYAVARRKRQMDGRCARGRIQCTPLPDPVFDPALFRQRLQNCGDKEENESSCTLLQRRFGRVEK